MVERISVFGGYLESETAPNDKAAEGGGGRISDWGRSGREVFSWTYLKF
jgi:hypothetical protein